MKCRDMCYWLQGFMELSKVVKLTEAQIKCIKAHLDMTFSHDPELPYSDFALQSSKAGEFCHWLRDVISILDEEGVLEILREQLNRVFVQEIDPSFPAEEQEALDELHQWDSEMPPILGEMKC